MIVISDTSVITNLIQLRELNLLHQLFENIIIPSKVFEELEKLPEQAKYIKQIEWIEIEAISNHELFEELIETLDPGESESIVLALELNADL
jgi:predicted nucleic acid-binding protein